MLVELLLLLAIILLMYKRWSKRHVYKLGKQLNSGIWALPFIGHSYMFLGDNQTRMKAMQTLGRDAIKNYNGLTSAWNGSYLYTMIADPEAAELVLKTCLEKDDVVKMTTLFIGNGSINAPVSIWRPRRKVLTPGFSMKNLKNFMSIFVQESAVLVHQMGKMAGLGSLPAYKYYTAHSIDVIARTTLGNNIDAQKNKRHPFLTAFEEGLASVAERFCQPRLHSDLVYTNLPTYRRLMKKKQFICDFFTALLKKKRKGIEEKLITQDNNGESHEGNFQTFLECMIRLSGGDEGYTDSEILEELMVLMIAGYDTSAVATSIISVMLSRHPEIQKKVYLELREVFGDSDRSPTLEDLPRLKYLEAVIRETLRLYPPAPIIVRKVEKNVVLPSGITLVPGTGVIVNIWALHRNTRYWGDDAELFRPERFIDTPLTHPAAFIPFSHGPRNCAGHQFAMMSMKTALSTVLRRFRVLPAIAPNNNSDYPPLRLKFDVMLKDEDGFQIKIESRC